LFIKGFSITNISEIIGVGIKTLSGWRDVHNWEGEKEVIGVLRTYMTRHGVGPFNGGLEKILVDKNNPHNDWQDSMRFGLLDFNLLRYALKYDGNINSLALTHIDEIGKIYQPGEFPDVEKELGLKIKVKSFGPKSNEKELI
jgi:hypothetical protein